MRIALERRTVSDSISVKCRWKCPGERVFPLRPVGARLVVDKQVYI